MPLPPKKELKGPPPPQWAEVSEEGMANQNGGRAQALGGRQSKSERGGDTAEDAEGDGLGPW